MKYYHLYENYRQIQTFRSLSIAISITSVVLILFASTSYFDNILNEIIKKYSSTINISDIKNLTQTGIALFGSFSGFMSNISNPHALTIRFYNVAMFYNNRKAEISIPSQTKSFNLSLHNFSNQAVEVFFLGVCHKDKVKDIMNVKGWNESFVFPKNANIPYSAKSFERIEPNGDSKTQTIDCNALKDNDEYCAVYYIKEDKRQHNIFITRHFEVKQ